MLLSRQTDPTKVVIAVECTPTSPVPPSSPSVKPASLNLGESGTKVVQSFPAVVHNVPPEVHHYPRVVHQIPKVSKKVPEMDQEVVISATKVEVIQSVPALDETEGSETREDEEEVTESVPEASSVVSPVKPVVQQEAPAIASPKPSRHHAALRKTVAEETKSDKGSRTPSPSTSRKSSFTNLFRRTESPLSPESPTSKRKNVFTTKLKEASDGLRERSRSRSKSSERNTIVYDAGKTKKDSKNKSVFSSLFKKKTKRSSSSGSVDDIQSPQEAALSPEDGTKLTDAIGNVEFTFATVTEPADRRGVIHERVVSEDREEREDAAVVVPPELPPKIEEAPPEPQVPADEEKCFNEVKCLNEQAPVQPVQHLGDNLERHDSSDSEMERSSKSTEGHPEGVPAEVDHERKGLVMQDSFEDELPYVPTTLPQERSNAVHIVPVSWNPRLVVYS